MNQPQHQPCVVITEPLTERPTRWLRQRARIVASSYTDPGELAGHLATAWGLVIRTYTQVTADLIGQGPNLKVVGRAGVGLENIDLDACRQRGVRVVYTPEANTQAVVEYVLALMLDALRPRTNLDHPVGADTFHRLRETDVGRQLDELTLGIVGFGHIGKRIGRIAHAIGMNLKVCDLLPEAELRKAVDFPFQFVDHASLYAQSDVVSLHVDGRPENRHLVNAGALEHLRTNALLINCARGMIVDPVALADWACAHPDGRVVLDVHDPEPPLPAYPLFGLPNVRLLPHIAARTQCAMENMGWVVKDVAAVLAGDEPQFPAV